MLKRLNRVAGFWLLAPPFKFLERKIQMIEWICQRKDIFEIEIDNQGGVGIYLVVFIIPSMGKDGNSTPIENILGLNLNLNCYP